jgi:hypothetical protein
LVLADPANTKLHLLDTGGQYDDVNYTSYIERTGLHFGDPQMQKLCTSVSLNIEGSGAVNVYIGSHTSAEGSVSWSGPFSFTPGTDHKVDCLVTGRYLAIKVESLDKVVWEFHSYEMKITNLGVN